jgi:hypothetical protein
MRCGDLFCHTSLAPSSKGSVHRSGWRFTEHLLDGNIANLLVRPSAFRVYNMIFFGNFY